MFGYYLKRKHHSPIWDNNIYSSTFKQKLYALSRDGDLEKLIGVPIPEETPLKMKGFIEAYYKNAGNLIDFYKEIHADEQLDEMPPHKDTAINYLEGKSIYYEGQIKLLVQGLIQGRTHKRDVYEYAGYGLRHTREILYSMPEQHYPIKLGLPDFAPFLCFGVDETTETSFTRMPRETVYNPSDVIPELDEEIIFALDELVHYVEDISSTYISFAANSKIIIIILWLIGFVYGLYIFCYFFYYFYKFIVLGILGLIKWIGIRSGKMIKKTETTLLKMAKYDRKGVRLSYFTNREYLSKMMSIGTTLLNERQMEVKQEEKERIKKEEEAKEYIKMYGLGLVGAKAKPKKKEPEEHKIQEKMVKGGKIVLTLVPRTNEEILKEVLSPFYYHSIFLAGKNRVFNISDELNVADYYNNGKRTKNIENVPEGLHLNWFYYDYYNYKNRNNYKGAFRYDFSTDHIISNMSEISNQRMIPIQKNGNKDGERSRFNFFDLPSGVLKQEKEKTKGYSTFPLGEQRFVKTPQFIVTMPANKLLDIVYGYCMLFMTGFCGNTWYHAAFYSFIGSLAINGKHLEIELGKKRNKEAEREEILNIKKKKETQLEQQRRDFIDNIVTSKEKELIAQRKGVRKYYRRLYKFLTLYIEEKKDFFGEELDLLKLKLKVLLGERFTGKFKENLKYKINLERESESTSTNWELFKKNLLDNLPRTISRINNFIKLLIFGTSFFVGGTYIIKSPSGLIFIREKVQRHEAFMQDKILNFGDFFIIDIFKKSIQPINFLLSFTKDSIKNVFNKLLQLRSLDVDFEFIGNVCYKSILNYILNIKFKMVNYISNTIENISFYLKKIIHGNEHTEELLNVILVYYKNGVSKPSKYFYNRTTYQGEVTRSAKIIMLEEGHLGKEQVKLKPKFFESKFFQSMQNSLNNSLGLKRGPIPEGIARAELDLLGIRRNKKKAKFIEVKSKETPGEYTDRFDVKAIEFPPKDLEKYTDKIREGGPMGGRIADYLTSFIYDGLGFAYAIRDLILVFPGRGFLVIGFVVFVVITFIIMRVNKMVTLAFKNDVNINKNGYLLNRFILSKHFKYKSQLKTEGIGGTLNGNGKGSLYTIKEKKLFLFYKNYLDKIKSKIRRKVKG